MRTRKITPLSNPTPEAVLARLHSLANPDNVAGMAKFGINADHTLGISIWELRKIAKEIQPDHHLAIALWDCGVHEARILGSFIMPPDQITPEEMDAWAADFNSWDMVDQVCALFQETPHGYQKVFTWSSRPEEFVKRAAFALIAEFAWHNKIRSETELAAFFPVIESHAWDERNFVKKAVNWALRNLGKRSPSLNAQAIACAERIQQQPFKSARWIGTDALRELKSEKIQERIKSGVRRGNV
jgi:3-methyladenine DNA glycosylase AlkD